MPRYLLILHDAEDPSEKGRKALQEKLIARFGFPDAAVAEMFRKLPVIVKRSAPEADARNYQRAFEEIGALVEVLEEPESGDLSGLEGTDLSHALRTDAAGAHPAQKSAPGGVQYNLEDIDSELSDLTAALDQELALLSEDKDEDLTLAPAAHAGSSAGELEFSISEDRTAPEAEHRVSEPQAAAEGLNSLSFALKDEPAEAPVEKAPPVQAEPRDVTGELDFDLTLEPVQEEQVAPEVSAPAETPQPPAPEPTRTTPAPPAKKQPVATPLPAFAAGEPTEPPEAPDEGQQEFKGNRAPEVSPEEVERAFARTLSAETQTAPAIRTKRHSETLIGAVVVFALLAAAYLIIPQPETGTYFTHDQIADQLKQQQAILAARKPPAAHEEAQRVLWLSAVDSPERKFRVEIQVTDKPVSGAFRLDYSEPPPLSAQDMISGKKPAVWLRRYSAFDLKPDPNAPPDRYVLRGNGRAFVQDLQGSTRVVATLELDCRMIENRLEGSWKLMRGGDIEKLPSGTIERISKLDFRFKLEGTFSAEAKPGEQPAVTQKAEDAATF